MAGLSCYETVKRARTSTITRQVIDLPRPSRISANSRKLYNVEVNEERENHVKIHYKGYSNCHDEWRLKSEIKYVNKPPSSEVPFNLLSEVACLIKNQLKPSRKEDPFVQIFLPFDQGVLQKTLAATGRHVGGKIHIQ